MSERFVTLRALKTAVPDAGLETKHGGPDCSRCPHPLLDHRLYAFDLDNPLLGGMTSCPLCDCAGTWGVTSNPEVECVGHSPDEHCDQLPDGGE